MSNNNTLEFCYMYDNDNIQTKEDIGKCDTCKNKTNCIIIQRLKNDKLK